MNAPIKIELEADEIVADSYEIASTIDQTVRKAFRLMEMICNRTEANGHDAACAEIDFRQCDCQQRFIEAHLLLESAESLAQVAYEFRRHADNFRLGHTARPILGYHPAPADLEN